MTEPADRRPAGTGLAQPAPDAPALPPPVDAPYPGIIGLEVDARDVERTIFRVRETVPDGCPLNEG